MREAAERARAEGVAAVAISFLHAYANPAHERRAAEIVREVVGDDVYITCSSDILAEIREYERTSTAVVNAYVGPVVERYIRSLESSLAAAGISAPLQIMQSSGGLMSAAAAIRKPAHLVESGPAAGVVACAFLARETGIANVISLDMGGTTAKAAILEDGLPVKTSEYEVGAGINLSSRLVKGGGYAIRLPFIDLSEIGAGGGSLVSADEFGMLHVGPESAGSDPGPACYGLGGDEPTLTDALVVLGYLSPEHLAGGAVELDADAAARALESVAEPLGKSTTEAAYGVFQLAVATMTRAVKAVSTYRGRDPREFVLCGFGGNGPVVAVAIARALQMRRVLVPVAPGVFSAAGLLLSEIEHEFVRTLPARGASATAELLLAGFRELEAEADGALVAEGVSRDAIAVSRFADVRYAGQAYELTLPIAAGAPDLGRIAADFGAEHHRTYGHASADAPIDIVNLKLTARAAGNGEVPYDPLAGLAAATARADTRSAYFGPAHGSLDVPVISRAALLDSPPRQGPLIVEEYDSTCVVPPGCVVTLDSLGNIDIALDVHGAAMTAVAIDPITLEVVKNALASVADEMALVVMRSAYSPVVRDTMDYSTALCDRDGELLAQGLTLAVQLGTFPTVMRHVREHFGEDIQPGDVFLANDPYGFGGQHLPDLYVIQPIFHQGVLEGYAATMAHHVDVGGITPGLDRGPRDRDLPGGAAAAVAEAVRGRPRERDRDPDHREEHAPAGRGDRRPAGPDRRLPRRRARADRDPEAVRHRRVPALPGRAAGAERAPDARRAGRPAGRHIRVRGLHRRVRRCAGAAADRGRADRAGRRGLGRPRGDGAAGGGGAQLPRRHGQRRRLLRLPRDRRPARSRMPAATCGRSTSTRPSGRSSTRCCRRPAAHGAWSATASTTP